MNDYKITWVIELYADSPRDAAQQARDIQLDWGSEATVFTVEDLATNTVCDIDVADEG